MRFIDQFDQGLVASHRAREAAEILGVEIEAAGGARNPHIRYPHSEPIKRTTGGKAYETDAAVQIKVDQVAVRRAIGDPAERRDAGQGCRDGFFSYSRRSPECLLHDRVDSKVAAKLCGDAACGGVGDRKALR